MVIIRIVICCSKEGRVARMKTKMIICQGEACLVAHCDRARGFAVAKTVAREVSTA